MVPPAAWLTLALALQVPPPDGPARRAEALRQEYRTALDREAARLGELARRLESKGQAEAAGKVREGLPAAPAADGASTFRPLPEVVPAADSVKAEPWQAESRQVRTEAATALFDLAGKALGTQPRHYGLADACLRGVVDRQPDHPEARRLLGYVPHNGGWATPYAVRQLKGGMVPHPIYGWVPKDWVPHLERGELPARGGSPGRESWLPAADADAQRREFARGWTIDTEHFHIQTNVPLSEAIAFGRHLEGFLDLFESRFADVIGDDLPLAQRAKDKSATGERKAEPHAVSYFATREEYSDALRSVPDFDPSESLGYYLPARGRARRGHAYFFRDAGGDLEAEATLFHEVSHQLLFESGVARPDDFRKNFGNYWVFEGLGTYFETVVVRKDGTFRVGGLNGARNQVARNSLVGRGKLIPLAAFVNFDKARFNGGDIILKYQQASALATFLIDGQAGRYREDFLAYVKDACQGRLRRASGKTLEDRLGTPYAQLEREFTAYLRTPEPRSADSN